jgi:hypothetical protein
MYDVVFKKMMENEKVAKFFIGTLLNETIDHVEFKPQELIHRDELAGLAVFRLDFIATIKTNTGKYRKILIEIEKAKNDIDLMRFRSYLAEQYKKEDRINNEKLSLPITTIYILGFNLRGIDSPCIKVERNYKDLINNIIIEKKNDFVEKLTHDCFIVQVNKITDRFQTKLDQLLSVFEQNHFTDDTKIIKVFSHLSDLDDLNLMTTILHESGVDPEERKKLEVEQEAWRTVEAMFEERYGKLIRKVENKEKLLEVKEKEIEDKEKEIEVRDKVIEDKDKMIEEMNRKIKELEDILSKY